MAEEAGNQTQVGIASIKVVSFEINEERVPKTGQGFQISFDMQHQINLEQKLYGLLLTITFWTGELSNSVLKIQVENGFSISNLQDFTTVEGTETQINMPQQLMAMLLDVSLHHSRALISDYTVGTTLEQNYLPLINPVEMLQQMQPQG